ncbi:pectinesterase/pectinesterase inhibitor [Fagus crenata]
MATHQPLLENPKTSHYKTFYLFLTFTAIISSIALVATHFIRPSSSNPFLQSHICDQEGWIDTDTIMQMNDVHLLQVFLERSTSAIQKAMDTANNVNQRINNNPREQAALLDCMELMDLSKDRVFDSIVALKNMTTRSFEDAHAWLSSVLTNHVTCLDGLEGSDSAWTSMEPGLKDLLSRAKTSLAMLVAISPMKTKVMIDEPLYGEFPSWVTGSDRRLLQALPKEIKANVVVAKDGSGKYKTVNEAVASAPNNGKTRYVIYVKKGTYKENVEVGKSKKNVMIVGDGMDSTIITGSLNVVDGSTTFNSATVVAVGDGFIAQDIRFQNTAGPKKHQAVALRVGADQSVINRCRIDAYQDTLYTHSNRQFFRDSYIIGTVDFIFGNAAVVFQNCKIVARKPMSGQANMVTAQGRTDPNQATGTSIQNSDIIASSDLEPVKGSIRSYLGRPWKEYSRTVVMQSYIGNHIDPTGWSVWDKDFALKTLYYGEYNNRGPGAGTSKRVKWSGYHVITNTKEAKKFTVAELIQGGTWLKSTGVTYTEGL